MSDRTSIVLRREDRKKFEEIKERLDYERNTDAFRHLLRFYTQNSPFWRSRARDQRYD